MRLIAFVIVCNVAAIAAFIVVSGPPATPAGPGTTSSDPAQPAPDDQPAGDAAMGSIAPAPDPMFEPLTEPAISQLEAEQAIRTELIEPVALGMSSPRDMYRRVAFNEPSRTAELVSIVASGEGWEATVKLESRPNGFLPAGDDNPPTVERLLVRATADGVQIDGLPAREWRERNGVYKIGDE